LGRRRVIIIVCGQVIPCSVYHETVRLKIIAVVYTTYGNGGIGVHPVYAVIRLEIGDIVYLITGVDYGNPAIDYLHCSGYGLQGLGRRVVIVTPLGKD
jgi:hypothetical protein